MEKGLGLVLNGTCAEKKVPQCGNSKMLKMAGNSNEKKTEKEFATYF